MWPRGHFIENEIIALYEELNREDPPVVAAFHEFFAGVDDAAAERCLLRIRLVSSHIQRPCRDNAEVQDAALVDIAAYREMDGFLTVAYHDDAAFIVERHEGFQYARNMEQFRCFLDVFFFTDDRLAVSVIA